MPITTTRRRLLAGSAAALALPAFARAQSAVKPRLTVISQWSAGSDGAAITALGKKFEEKGGVWQHSPVPGFTTEMMNKLRAQIIAGDPPACSQLKGPEIAAWSKIAPTVDLDALVAAAGYEKVVAPDLARLHKPTGKWISLPLQIYSTNMLFLSKRAMDKAKADKIPVTWADFNDLAEKMKAGGITYPIANGGTRADDGQKFEASFAGVSPAAYRAAIMNLDKKALEGPEIRAAFAQMRKIADWMDPNVGAQPYATNLKRFVDGDMGMMIMGGWAQGVLRNAGFKFDDYILAPAQRARSAGRSDADGPARHGSGDPDHVLADHGIDPCAHRCRSFRRRLVGRSTANLSCAQGRCRQQSGRPEPRPQHGAGKRPDRCDDRRVHGVREEQDDYAGAGGHPPRRGRRGLTLTDTVSTATRTGRPAMSGLVRRLPEYLMIWVPLLLSAAHLVSFSLWTIWISFTPSTLVPVSGWVGLRNYNAVLASRNWQIAFDNLLLFGSAFVLLSLVTGLMLAILLDQRIRGENVLRSIFLYPLAVSFVVTGTVWSWLLNPGIGIEKLVHDLGWTSFRFDWLVNRDMAIWTIVIAAIWQSSGFAMALFLAGLRSVDADIIKAAQIDGAGPIRTYWRVILPTLWPITITVVVVQLQFAGRGAAAAVLMLLILLAVLLPYAAWRYVQRRQTTHA